MVDTSSYSGEFPESFEEVKMQPIPKRQWRFFYERPDGSIIDCTEQEAASNIKSSQKFRNFRPIGVSDGQATIDYMMNCGYRAGQMVPIKKAQEIMRGAYEAELEAARKNGNTRQPQYNGVIFDSSFPMEQRGGFVPPR